MRRPHLPLDLRLALVLGVGAGALVAPPGAGAQALPAQSSAPQTTAAQATAAQFSAAQPPAGPGPESRGTVLRLGLQAEAVYEPLEGTFGSLAGATLTWTRPLPGPRAGLLFRNSVEVGALRGRPVTRFDATLLSASGRSGVYGGFGVGAGLSFDAGSAGASVRRLGNLHVVLGQNFGAGQWEGYARAGALPGLGVRASYRLPGPLGPGGRP